MANIRFIDNIVYTTSLSKLHYITYKPYISRFLPTSTKNCLAPSLVTILANVTGTVVRQKITVTVCQPKKRLAEGG